MIRVAIIAGGDSSEAEVSRRSAQQVLDALDRSVYEPYLVELSAKEWVCNGAKIDKNDFSATIGGQKITFQCAVIMIHGTPGENGILQGYFDLIDLPYTTAGVEIMATTFNKTLCKNAVRNLEGVHLAGEIIIQRGEKVDPQQITQKLGLPFFIKPTKSGSSFGVSKITATDQIQQAVQIALKESDQIMCEEFIDGTEVSQGVMITGGEELVMPITELVTQREFFDYTAKYTPGLTQEITPARITPAEESSIGLATLNIYKALECHGVIRIDYIIKGHTPYFIEVNAIPGMSAQSIIPQQWAHLGISIGEGFGRIIADTIAKHNQKTK